MTSRTLGCIVLALSLLLSSALGAGPLDKKLPDKKTADKKGEDKPDANAWPRDMTTDDGTKVTMYQPQIEKWEQNKLEARAAVAVQAKAAASPTFGVVWITARTEVNKEDRIVTLDDVKIPKVNFPSGGDKTGDYLALAKQVLPRTARTVPLDQLEANLSVNQAEAAPKTPLKNDPPQIIVNTGTAILVLVDGKPVLRKVEGSKLLRVINTRALMLFDEPAAKYYLAIGSLWASSAVVEGKWKPAAAAPDALDAAKKTLTDKQPFDLIDDIDPESKALLDKNQLPAIYVSTVPAELIELDGEPEFAPIEGTQLLWIKNTSNEILMNVATQNYYVLLSGRWFRAKALKGPWEYVPNDSLPADVAKIPMAHPKGDVLASVSGTPQAKELAIANQVPQTATVKRAGTKITPAYDGEPKFEPIEGTALSYAANTATPIIQTGESAYYAVENGVWFMAADPAGPYAVAASVPAAIYTIPPSSPVYYVTFVRVYSATPEEVYVGYTPGYFGTCMAPGGCVVYGTGYRYKPWVGAAWYGRPWSYGFGTAFGWGGAGWGFSFAGAAGRPWWGPVGWNTSHAGGGSAYRSGWERGWGGAYNNHHVSQMNFNNFNTYNRFDNNTVKHPSTTVNKTTNKTTTVNNTNTRNTYAGNKTATVDNKNNVYAGKDGNVYRNNGDKGWEQQGDKDNKWKPVDKKGPGGDEQKNLQKDQQNRYAGQQHYDGFKQAGGSAGAHPPTSGGKKGGGGRKR